MSRGFDDLSQTMTSEQKRELLGKIQQSLNLSSRDTDSIVTKVEDPDELKHRLGREIAKLGALDRFFLKIAAFFLSRSESEVMADRRLGGSRSTLNSRVPELVSFSHQEWSPEFGKVVYDIFAEASDLKSIFDHLFQQKITLEAGLLLLFREEHSSAARSLEDVFPDREMTSLYKADQKLSSLQTALDQKVSAYFETIPAEVFETIKERLRPLYYLRPLVMFPYASLLEIFGHNPEKVEVTKYPFLIGAPWRKSAGLLERLYYGLYLTTKFEWKEGSLNEIFHGVVDHLSNEKKTWDVETINKKVDALVKISQEIAQRIPWKEVLQWSFQDPYYSVKYILPKYSVKDFYQTSITLNLQEELTSMIPEMRQRVLTEERTFLFEGGSPRTLEHYKFGSGTEKGNSTRIENFQHSQTLGLLWDFLNNHFTRKIQPFHQSLSRLVAPASKSSLAGLGNIIEELSSLKTQIHQFDKGLHPDSEDGKELLKLKYEASLKTFGLKPLAQFVQNKDDQARQMITRGIEGIQILKNQFAGIREKNIPALKSILGLPYLLDGRQETVENGLDRVLQVLQKALFVLKETDDLEN